MTRDKGTAHVLAGASVNRSILDVIGCAWISGACVGFLLGVFFIPVLRWLGAW